MVANLTSFTARQEKEQLKEGDTHPVTVMDFYTRMHTVFSWGLSLGNLVELAERREKRREEMYGSIHGRFGSPDLVMAGGREGAVGPPDLVVVGGRDGAVGPPNLVMAGGREGAVMGCQVQVKNSHNRIKFYQRRIHRGGYHNPRTVTDSVF